MFDPKTSPFVVIDVETTGLLPEEDRVVEVGAIRLVGGKEDAAGLLKAVQAEYQKELNR